MKNTLKISLKPNEKIYLNGAVIRVDRKVTIELLNDVQFLLESHVLQANEASTPLRQLYFMVQIMLIDPQGAAGPRAVPQVAAALDRKLHRSADLRGPEAGRPADQRRFRLRGAEGDPLALRA